MTSAARRNHRSSRSAAAALDPVSVALRRPRLRLVATVLARKRAEYSSELAGPPSLAALRAIAVSERITVVYDDLGADLGGQVFRHAGIGVVMLNQAMPHELRRRVCAHELAHLWLEHDGPVLKAWRSQESGLAWYGPVRTDGPLYQRTEDEADLLASALLGLTVDAYRAPVRRWFERAARRDADRARAAA